MVNMAQTKVERKFIFSGVHQGLDLDFQKGVSVTGLNKLLDIATFLRDLTLFEIPC